jgi:integration host factor subunit alpha
MTVTKELLVNSIEDHLDLTKIKSNEVFESLMEIIKNALESGEDVLISGFGKFCVKDKNQRRGRNPATGEDKMMRARRVVVFKYSGILRDMINGKE